MSITGLCSKAGMSRQNFYKERKQRQRREIDGNMIEMIVSQERRIQPRIGGLKLHIMYKDELKTLGVKVGRDKFFEILAERGLVLEKLPRSPRTTNSRHYLPVFKNLEKETEVTARNQVWVCDITYVSTMENFLYLSLITDKKSRKIVGYHAAETLETQGCIKALDMALKQLSEGEHPIHHSDRGCQYCSHEYVNELIDNGIKISMTEENHAAENSMAERVNETLKYEYSLRHLFRTRKQALRAIDQAVFLYNNRRLHESLGYKTPAEVFQAAA